MNIRLKIFFFESKQRLLKENKTKYTMDRDAKGCNPIKTEGFLGNVEFDPFTKFLLIRFKNSKIVLSNLLQ